MSDYSNLQNAFYQELLKNLRSSVGSVKNLSNLKAFEQETNGGFAWFWNIQRKTNSLTYQLMNTATSYNKATGAIKSSETSAINTALAVYEALQYKLSEADQTALNASNTKASTQANNLVNAWNSAGLPQITDADMKKAEVSTPLDYVVHQFTDVWSDTQVNWRKITDTRNPAELFPKAPPSADSLLGPLVSYVKATADVATIRDNELSSNWLKNKLVNAIQSPAIDNGAITTKDPISGTENMVPKWTVQQDTTSLQETLEGSSQVKVKMHAEKHDETTVNVSMGGRLIGGFGISFLSFFGGGGASYTSFSQKGSGSSVDIELTYNGVGVANFVPEKFDQVTLKGWYDQKTIAQAYANRDVGPGGRPSVSGYCLSGLNPSYILGDNGNGGYMTAAVFSNPPAINMTYTKGDYSVFKSHFHEETSWGVGLFGIKLFGGHQSYDKAVLKEESTSGGFSITFPPKKITESGSTAAAQLAAVLAVNPAWMGLAS